MNWVGIQLRYHQDPAVHWQSCLSAGLHIPQEVFVDIFWTHHQDTELEVRCRAIDWTEIEWHKRSLSAVAIRRVGIWEREQSIVDILRMDTYEIGISVADTSIINTSSQPWTWPRAPVVVDGMVFANICRFELLVGFERWGPMLGLLDRGDISEMSTHDVWIGTIR